MLILPWYVEFGTCSSNIKRICYETGVYWVWSQFHIFNRITNQFALSMYCHCPIDKHFQQQEVQCATVDVPSPLVLFAFLIDTQHVCTWAQYKMPFFGLAISALEVVADKKETKIKADIINTRSSQQWIRKSRDEIKWSVWVSSTSVWRKC